MVYVAGTGDDTGQADWLEFDGPESQARESLKDFKHREVVLGLSCRHPLRWPCQGDQQVRPAGGGSGKLCNHRKGWARA